MDADQILCNRKVFENYLIKPGTQLNDEAVGEVIKVIMDSFPKQNIYFGISSHVCGRFTSNYDNTITKEYYLYETAGLNLSLADEEVVKGTFNAIAILKHIANELNNN